MITFATEPGVFTRFLPGEQFPGLPGGLRFPALVGEAQTTILRENVPVTKGGLLSFSYNALTGLLTTSQVLEPEDVLNIIAIRKNGLDFELVTIGNSTTNYDLADISLAAADISAVRVGLVEFTPTPAPTPWAITITGAGYSSPVLNIVAGDTVTWTNADTISHGIKNEDTSQEIFDSGPFHLGPGDSFVHQFQTSGVFSYFDPLLPQDTSYRGVIVVDPLQGYTYDEPNREISFTEEIAIAKNQIEIDTIFTTSLLPVTIRLDGRGHNGPYDVDISPPQIQTILKAQLMNIPDFLPDTDIVEITRVGNSPFTTDFTPLDYLLLNNTIEWGAAVTKASGFIALASVEAFADKVFPEVGGDLDVLDDTWTLTVTTVGMVGVGSYTITRGSTGTVSGPFLTSPGIVPGSPIPGVNLIVTDTTGTTLGDTVILTTNAGTAKEPEAGEIYFVSYKVRKTNFNPGLFFRFGDVRREYGDIVAEFNPNGSVKRVNNLVLASFLAFINGAPGLVLAQTDFGLAEVSTATDFINAIDLLKEIDDVGIVVPLSSDNIVRNFAVRHVNIASGFEFKRERMTFVSAPANSTMEELIGIARGIADRRAVLVTPTAATTEIQDQFGNASNLTVEGFFLAAALSGLDSSVRFDVAEPITRKRIVGFRRLENEFLKPEKDRLSANGVLTIQTIGASHSVRQAITTSIASIEEREISITKITDFTARAVRHACDRFIGTKLLDETTIWIEAAIANILQQLVNARILNAFGGISAVIDPTRPDTVAAEFAIRPVYPCNFILVTFTINNRL